MIQTRSGFSLMELVVAIVILGILAALIGPRLMRFFIVAKEAAAKSDVRVLKEAVESYYMETQKYPKDLVVLTEGGRRAILSPETVKVEGRNILDPWKQPYVYRVTPKPAPHPFELYSKGDPEGDGVPISAWDPVR